jgi:twinkle protein
VQGAEPMPLEGVYTVDDYKVDVKHLYSNGMMGGLSTGMPSVDELFTIKQGQLSIVTGVPGSGKSEFIDQLMVNLAQKYDWKFAVASFENPPPLHIAKLAEKIVGKPFFDGLTPRMSQQEADDALDYIHDHWMFLEQRGGEATTLDSILDRAQQSVMRMGVRGLVIDPYNYIAQSQKVDNEHQGINEMLTRLVSFARSNGIHIWFIAHPAKMPTDQDGKTAVPKGMNISGSAAFFAKADLGVTVHQNKNKEVEIHCWKVRFKWLGSVGKTTLHYDIPTGRYSEAKYDIRMPESIKSYQEKDEDWF